MFQRSRIIQYCCNHIILRLKKKKKKKKSHHLWRKPVQMIRLATSTPGHVEVNRWSATVHSRAPELRLQQSLCFYFSSAGLTALPLRIVEEIPWTFLHLFFLFLQLSTSSIETDMKLRHGNFGRWRSESFRISNLPPKTNTNLNKFFHFDENIEIYREMHLWSVPCIDCCSSRFGVLYATTVDWQMIQRYLRHLSFYSAPSCLNNLQVSCSKTKGGKKGAWTWRETRELGESHARAPTTQDHFEVVLHALMEKKERKKAEEKKERELGGKRAS